MPRLPRAVALTSVAALLVTGAAGCTDDGGSTTAFCARVKEVPALETVLDRFTEADPTVLDDRIEKARTAYDDLAEAAPKQIADETDSVVDLVDEILDAVQQNPTDPDKASDQLRKAVAAHQGIDADRAAVAAFAQDHCDVQLDATLSSGPSGATTTTAPGSVITAPGATTSTSAPSDDDTSSTTGG